MNLRAKTVFAVYVVIICLMLGLYGLLRVRTMEDYERLEADQARQAVLQVQRRWEQTRSALAGSATDSVRMAGQIHQQTGAVDIDALIDLLGASERLDFVAVVDARGALQAAKTRSLEGDAGVPVALVSRLRDLGVFAADGGTAANGYLLVTGRPVVAAVVPLPLADGSRSWLVVARHLADPEVADTPLDFQLLEITTIAASSDATARGEIEVMAVDDETVRASTMLADIAGRPVLRLVIDSPRPFRSQANQVIQYSLATLAVAGLLIATAIVLSLEWNVIRRLRSVQRRLGEIRELDDLSLRLEENGADEIDGLVTSINSMLGTLAGSRLRLQHSEDRYRRMIDTAQEAIWFIGTDGRTRFANIRLLSLLSTDEESLRRSAVSSWIVPASMANMQRLVESLDGQTPLTDLQLRRADGSQIWTIASASRVQGGDPQTEAEDAGTLIMLMDISERKRQESQLQAQAELLNRTRDAIIVTDTAGRIVQWNQGAATLYRIPIDTAVGQLLDDLVPIAGSTSWGSIRADAAMRGDWLGELRHPGATPMDTRTVLCRCNSVVDWQDLPAALLVVCTDLTEQKQLEQHMLRSQRLESIGTLAGGLAHDLNNTLAPILSTVWLLRRKRPDTFPDKAIDTIERSAQRGVDIVKQVLAFARGVDARRTTVHPYAILHDLEAMVAKTVGHRIDVRFNIPRDLWMIIADATQLHQAVLNLCMNARDAMPDGGTLTVVAANRMLDAAAASRIAGASPGPFLRITVSDTGTGIPPDVMDRIFDPFFTTKDVGKGTGMGLSIVLSILKAHRGFMAVDSTVGEGTVFRLFLPASPEAQQTIPALEHDSVELRPGQGQTILLIDDEVDILDTTRELLEFHGYATISAENGADAIALYGKHRDRIAIVLTDMNMPVMDGPQTIAAIHRINPRAMIIAVSGAVDPQEALAGQEHAVLAFLRRPYEPVDLLSLLSRHLP